MATVVYGNQPETILREKPKASARRLNHVLMGTWLEILEENADWLRVRTRSEGRGGWVRRSDVRTDPGLKIFYVDVGQGDGAIVESPQGLILIDGGPGQNLYRFLLHRYGPLLRDGRQLEIAALVMSHPDQDHYEGFISLLLDARFKIGTIYHNGIIRYLEANLPTGLTFDLGALQVLRVNGQVEQVLVDSIDSLADVQTLVDSGHLLSADGTMNLFGEFWRAALQAHAAGRLSAARRLTVRDKYLPGFAKAGAGSLQIRLLGPVPVPDMAQIAYVALPDPAHLQLNRPDPLDPAGIPRPSSSHTRNGHSLVLMLIFGKHRFLFGGDLNIPAQLHLMRHYGSRNPFRCDVAKACHHGSSDFHVEFLKKARPQVNVVSSGDNKSFDHPVADALGAMGRHTSGDHPLLFSTELARAVNSRNEIHYGLINARSNGEVLVMAQMKEQHRDKADVWDSFTVPWVGRFSDALSGP